jgi:hypothetical protein
MTESSSPLRTSSRMSTSAWMPPKPSERSCTLRMVWSSRQSSGT